MSIIENINLPKDLKNINNLNSSALYVGQKLIIK